MCENTCAYVALVSLRTHKSYVHVTAEITILYLIIFVYAAVRGFVITVAERLPCLITVAERLPCLMFVKDSSSKHGLQ